MSNLRIVDKKTGDTHAWLRRTYGDPKACEHCGKEGRHIAGRWTIHYARKHGFPHARILNNYLELCTSCHGKYDSGDGRTTEPNIPMKDKRKILFEKIKGLHRLGWTYDEIAEIMRVSKATAFLAVNGKKKGKAE
jgi:hypothetical protein